MHRGMRLTQHSHSIMLSVLHIELLGIAGFVQSSELSTAQVSTHELCELFIILRDVTWMYSCV